MVLVILERHAITDRKIRYNGYSFIVICLMPPEIAVLFKA
jgi:hypothetical protein